jgi:hypothetical protein
LPGPVPGSISPAAAASSSAARQLTDDKAIIGAATDPIGRLLFTVLSMIADHDLARAHTLQGLAVAKANGPLRGKPPKLKPTQEAHLVKLCEVARTPRSNWPSCSPSAVRRCTARSSEEAPARPARPPEAEAYAYSSSGSFASLG